MGMERVEAASSLAARAYTDGEVLAVEQQAVLRLSWQFVAGVSQLQEPGSTVVTEVLGEPVVLVANRLREIKAYYNVCQHRGGPVAKENKCHRVLQCHYHGWTYSLDGDLIGAPHMDQAEGFCKAEVKLRELNVAIWNGLVFVTLAPPALTIDQTMQGIAERIGRSFADYQLSTVRSYQVAANWKIYVDNYLEGYHVPFVHPTLNQALQFSAYKTEVHQTYSLQHSPLSQDSGVYRGGDNQAFYYFICPNLMFNILPGRLQINQVIPIDAGRCVVWFYYLYAPDKPNAARQEDQEFADIVQHEDIAICEHLQKAMATGAFSQGRYSPVFESAVHHFHSYLRQAVYAKLNPSF